MAVVNPLLALLDETDSGLDIDAANQDRCRRVSTRFISPMRKKAILAEFTHYQRLLNYIVPDHVHVMIEGRIVKSGGKKLAASNLKEKGYDWVEEEVAAKA